MSWNEGVLRLRALEMSDLKLLDAVENDPSHWAAGSTLAPLSRFMLSRYLRESAENDIYALRAWKMVAETPDSHEAVGLVDLFNFEPEHARVEMGVLVLPAFRGRHYGAAMVCQTLGYLREVLHVHEAHCIVAQSNTASQQMLLRAGFVQSGVLKDWCRIQGGYESAFVYQCLLD
ncbi:MAG: GNAT family N-acetyltransferase [Paludibacteraceae bacterium]|nr:GNAT family N-acetyltransferase [Paludibacteraceae bacterium]